MRPLTGQRRLVPGHRRVVLVQLVVALYAGHQTGAEAGDALVLVGHVQARHHRRHLLEPARSQPRGSGRCQSVPNLPSKGETLIPHSNMWDMRGLTFETIEITG